MHCHCGTNNRAPRWTFMDPCKPEVRPGAREESASPAWLAAPAKFQMGHDESRRTVDKIFNSLYMNMYRQIYDWNTGIVDYEVNHQQIKQTLYSLQTLSHCIQLWIRPVLFSPSLKSFIYNLFSPVLNSPSGQKKGAKFSLYRYILYSRFENFLT